VDIGDRRDERARIGLESARVILFDKRGTGLSDRVDHQPGMDDVRAVMDAVGVERAVSLLLKKLASSRWVPREC